MVDVVDSCLVIQERINGYVDEFIPPGRSKVVKLEVAELVSRVATAIARKTAFEKNLETVTQERGLEFEALRQKHENETTIVTEELKGTKQRAAELQNQIDSLRLNEHMLQSAMNIERTSMRRKVELEQAKHNSEAYDMLRRGVEDEKAQLAADFKQRLEVAQKHSARKLQEELELLSNQMKSEHSAALQRELVQQGERVQKVRSLWRRPRSHASSSVFAMLSTACENKTSGICLKMAVAFAGNGTRARSAH